MWFETKNALKGAFCRGYGLKARNPCAGRLRPAQRPERELPGFFRLGIAAFLFGDVRQLWPGDLKGEQIQKRLAIHRDRQPFLVCEASWPAERNPLLFAPDGPGGSGSQKTATAYSSARLSPGAKGMR